VLPAARIGDSTAHGGTLLPPVPPSPRLMTVLIEGKPAAVVGSVHECVVPQHAVLGPANRVLPAMGPPRMVLVAGLPLACVGDRTVCGANILTGAPTVLVGGGL
jgi:uncharacterized Zn-binding protein involved in type VI secretion